MKIVLKKAKKEKAAEGDAATAGGDAAKATGEAAKK